MKVRGFQRSLSAEPRSTIDETPYSSASLRVLVTRVGGVKPRGTFKSKAERRAFSLDLAGEEQASRLGAYVYKTVDIDALVTRDYDGNIEVGILRDFHPLVDDHEAWTAWFRENGSRHWTS